MFQHAQISSAAVDWSGAPAMGLSLRDLDPLQIERARQILRSKAPSSGLIDLPDLEFLRGLEAVRRGQVTHTLRIFNQGAHEALARLIARLDAQGAEVGLDQLLVLDAMLGQDFIDVGQAAEVLQLPKEDARRVLDAMAVPPLGLIERKGHTASATFHLAKGIAKELKGKAAYTKTLGLNPVRYAEMVREYLKDHQKIRNAELRELLGLGDSPSAQVEASRYLKKWSQPDGFLDKVKDSAVYYIYRKGI